LEETRFIRRHIGLHKPKRIFVDKKRQLYRIVVSPEMNGAPRVVEDPALVWEFKHVWSRR
jgi:hypothetical protein